MDDLRVLRMRMDCPHSVCLLTHVIQVDTKGFEPEIQLIISKKYILYFGFVQYSAKRLRYGVMAPSVIHATSYLPFS